MKRHPPFCALSKAPLTAQAVREEIVVIGVSDAPASSVEPDQAAEAVSSRAQRHSRRERQGRRATPGPIRQLVWRQNLTAPLRPDVKHCSKASMRRRRSPNDGHVETRRTSGMPGSAVAVIGVADVRSGIETGQDRFGPIPNSRVGWDEWTTPLSRGAVGHDMRGGHWLRRRCGRVGRLLVERRQRGPRFDRNRRQGVRFRRLWKGRRFLCVASPGKRQQDSSSQSL